MQKHNKSNITIEILSIVIFILLIVIILLMFNHKFFNNIIMMNNLSFIIQLLSYIATIIGSASIVFAYVQYKNTKKENNNKISNETINMLNDFATKVMPNMDAIYCEYNALNNSIIDNKKKDESLIKGRALDIKNNEMNYIDFWCRSLLMFKDRNMIQEDVLYDEDCDVLMDFLNSYKEAFKYKDPYNKYYKAIYILYNRWTNNDFNKMSNK